MLRIRIAAAKLVNYAGKKLPRGFSFCLTSVMRTTPYVFLALDAERPKSFQHKCVKSHASEAGSPGGIQHSEPMGLGVAGPTLGNLSLDQLCVRTAGISLHFAD